MKRLVVLGLQFQTRKTAAVPTLRAELGCKVGSRMTKISRILLVCALALSLGMPPAFAGGGMDGDSQAIMMSAAQRAAEMGQANYGPVHVLEALAKMMDSSRLSGNMQATRMALQATPDSLQALKNAARTEIEKLKKDGEAGKAVQESEVAKDMLERAAALANGGEITPKHLLVAALEKSPESVRQGAEKAGFRLREVSDKLSVSWSENDMKVADEKALDALERMGKNYVELARAGKFDELIGREREVSEMYRVLSRRKKRNPVLLGPKGVGKTAIVEGFALRIVRGDVPTPFKDVVVYEIPLGSLVAGTQYRGQLEEKVKELIHLAETNPNVILFIDELHTLMGAGKSEGGSGIEQLLKPALSRGLIRVVGATTRDEYEASIMKDEAMDRRFGPVFVGEPTPEDVREIIYNYRDVLERYYKQWVPLKITDEAVELAIKWSNDYMKNKEQPDKALTLLEDAAARALIDLTSSEPPKLRELKGQLKSIENALARESNAPSTRVRDKKIQELTQARDLIGREVHDLNSVWLTSAKIVKLLELERSQWQMEEDEWESMLGKYYEAESEIEKREEALLKRLADIQRVHGVQVTEVGSFHVAHALESTTGIRASNIQDSLLDKPGFLEGKLEENLFGQRQVVEHLGEIVRYWRHGLNDPKRPVRSMIFAGPSQVGKTYVTHLLAEALWGPSWQKTYRDFKMSQYRNDPMRLFGHGNEEGELLKFVRQNRECMIVLDKIEEGNADIYSSLLEAVERGYMFDRLGRYIDFSGAILIMTTRAGSDLDGDQHKSPKQKRQGVLDSLKKMGMDPDFLRQVDDVVPFNKLTTDSVEKAFAAELKELHDRTYQKFGVPLHIDAEAQAKLAEKVAQSGDAGDIRRAGDLIHRKLALPIIQNKVPAENIRVSLDPKTGNLVSYPAVGPEMKCAQEFEKLALSLEDL